MKHTELYAFFNNERPWQNPQEFIVGFDDRVFATTDDYDSCDLISKGEGFDVIACWNNDSPDDIAIYAGKWNDGPKVKEMGYEL